MLSVAKYFLAAQAILSFLFLKKKKNSVSCAHSYHMDGMYPVLESSVSMERSGQFRVDGTFSSLPYESR